MAAGYHPLHSGPAQRRTEQCQRSGGAKPRGVAAKFLEQTGSPPEHLWGGKHESAGMPDDWKRQSGVEGLCTRPVRCVDGNRVLWERHRQLV
jgi:hypothetical protein